MQWVTREHPRTDRIACPWLIRRFIDPDAEILYVPRERVLDVAAETGATSFDADGATYGHRDGKCSFEVMVDHYGLGADAGLACLARIVHGADVAADLGATAESAGLRAIADGFALLGLEDQRQLELELPVYDALYAWCRDEVGDGGAIPA